MAEIVQPGGSVTGIDLSEGMIERAQSAKEQKDMDNVSFRQMDAEALDFSEDTFDTIICSLGLMYYPNPVKALEEMFRVLKPGGRGAALVWGERGDCGWADIFPIVDRRVESDVCPLFFQLGTGDALPDAFEEAGFAGASSKRFTTKLHFRNDEQACTASKLNI
jgi:ubiquinone/menaquinone biosynthesis C-methylase UbiE